MILHPSRRTVHRNSTLLVLTISCLFLTLACDSGGGGTDPETVAAIAIEQGDLQLPVRAKTQLIVEMEDFDGNPLIGVEVTFASSASTVAEVDAQGWVTAMGEGSTTLSATAEGKSASIPVTVSELGFVSVAAGIRHTCGLLDSGAAWCWGRHRNGQLGLGEGDRGGNYPHPVSSSLTFQELSAGGTQTCGFTNEGEAYCWGEIEWGILTEIITEIWAVPQKVPGNLTFQSFRTGGSHMCGLTDEGKAYCWGWNSFSELGSSGSVTADAFFPFPGELRFRVLNPSGRHTCGIDMDGVTHCWGDNEFGELGREGSNFMGVVDGGHLFRDLAPMEGLSSCGITFEGDAYCWGRNRDGELGGGPSDLRFAPTLVPGGLEFRSLSIGLDHGCGVTVSDVAYCWGDNTYGQLGAGSGMQYSETPVLVHGSR